MNSLSLRLREGTKASHAKAEATHFMRCFLRGLIDRRSYRQLLLRLHPVYAMMEVQQERLASHPVVSRMRFLELDRRASLVQDLDFYFQGEAPWRDLPISEATRAYTRRVEEAAQEAPELLVAHLYTRYLGDLSGGQVLRGLVHRAFGLTDDAGVMFYRFEGIPDAFAFKNMYRRRLDELPIDDATAERIIGEANKTFGLNMRLFEELEAPLREAVGRQRFDEVVRR